MRDGSQISILALRVVKLVFKSNSIILSDYHCCPSFLMNIISVGFLAKDSYSLSIKNDYYDIIVNDVTIIWGKLRNSIYILSQPVSVTYTPNKHPKLDNVTNVYLWHCRLGHINKNRINRLTQEGILNISDCESLPTVSLIFLKRWLNHLFIGKGERAYDVLGLTYLMYADPWT